MTPIHFNSIVNFTQYIFYTMANLETILSWFQTGDNPTEEEFRQTFSSFRHNDTKIPITDVDGLESSLNNKLNVNDYVKDGKIRADKIEALGLTDLIESNESNISEFITNFYKYEFQQNDFIAVPDEKGNFSLYLFKGGEKNDKNNYLPVGISNINSDDFLPLTGTEVGKPVTGDIKINIPFRGNIKIATPNDNGLVFTSNNAMDLTSSANGTTSKLTIADSTAYLQHYPTNGREKSVLLTSDGIKMRGIEENTANTLKSVVIDEETDKLYFQNSNISNFIPLTGTEVNAPINGQLNFGVEGGALVKGTENTNSSLKLYDDSRLTLSSYNGMNRTYIQLFDNRVQIWGNATGSSTITTDLNGTIIQAPLDKNIVVKSTGIYLSGLPNSNGDVDYDRIVTQKSSDGKLGWEVKPSKITDTAFVQAGGFTTKIGVALNFINGQTHTDINDNSNPIYIDLHPYLPAHFQSPGYWFITRTRCVVRLAYETQNFSYMNIYLKDGTVQTVMVGHRMLLQPGSILYIIAGDLHIVK